MINDKYILETEGYQIIFELENSTYCEQSIDLVVKFVLNSQLEGLSVKSVPSCINTKDLKRLTVYLEQHIASLIESSGSVSPTFVEYGLSFQMQALMGDVETTDDGEFSLLVMVNVGKPEKGSHRVYVGGEAIVTVENVRKFVLSINTLLAELPT